MDLIQVWMSKLYKEKRGKNNTFKNTEVSVLVYSDYKYLKRITETDQKEKKKTVTKLDAVGLCF